MTAFVIGILAYCRAFFVTRHQLGLEVAALRQQLVVFKRKQPRPRLQGMDRFFGVALRGWWPGWSDAWIIVKSDTVAWWHGAGFRLFWRWRCRTQPIGRPQISEELRQLIRRRKRENPSWGAPRIHGELLRLGFDLSEPTVSRYWQVLKQRPEEAKAKRWLTFLHNHGEVVAAFDFFTVPTLTFRVLYCFLVIEHQRRQILPCNGTSNQRLDYTTVERGAASAWPLPLHGFRP